VLKRQPVHVLMTDQRMPNMTGVELLKRAHGTCPEAIRIVFTGYADIKAVIDAVNRGEIYRYLTKPWDPDELAEALREGWAHRGRIAGRGLLLAELGGYGADGLAGQTEERARQGNELLARLDRVLAGK